MALTNQELFEKGRPISSLFPIRADNGIIIEQQLNFRCSECENAIPELNVRGFIINRDNTLISHLFCQCPNCQCMTVFSDAYEERAFSVSLWRKKGDAWTHTQDIDIPKRYWHKVLWFKAKRFLADAFAGKRSLSSEK